MRAVFGTVTIATAVTVALSLEGWAQDGATYQAVAFYGDSAPGGGKFYWVGPPRIGEDGTIGFLGLTDSERSGLFKGKPGSLSLVAESGQAASGEDTTFSSFGSFSVSRTGKLAYLATQWNGETTSEGLWIEGAAGEGMTTVLDFGTLAFRPGTSVGFKARVAPPGETYQYEETDVLIAGSPSHLETILSVGDPAPGFPEGNVISRIFQSGEDPGDGVDMNEAGALAFKAMVSDLGSEVSVERGAIYAGSADSFRLVAAEGEPTSDSSENSFGLLDSNPSIASNGLVAFTARLYGVDSELTYAVFAGRPGQLRQIVKSGDIVPTTTDVVFQSFDRAVINETGDVVFGATIRYPNYGTRYGFWIQRSTGKPVLLAIDGITLDSPAGPALLNRVDMAGPGTFNDLHEFVFQVESDKGYGIYVADTRPGAPWIRITDPRRRTDQVTKSPSVRIAGVAMDETGIEDVTVTVTPIAEARGRKRHAKRRPARQVTDHNWTARIPLAMGRNLVTVTATDMLGNVSEPVEFEMIRWSPRSGERHLRPRR